MEAPLRRAAALLLLAAAAAAAAQTAPAPTDSPEALLTQALDGSRALAQEEVSRQITGDGRSPPRIDIQVGRLDSRLRLAPCSRIEPYIPNGQRLWGSSRIGLRCLSGPVRWNVYLPITVHAWGSALVAGADLPADTELAPQHLRLAEVDLAAASGTAYSDAHELLGRRLSVPVSAGSAIRSQHLRTRQWFGAGDQVTVIASGSGFSVSGTATALTPGQEGQIARLRTESGKIITGMPVGERKVELKL
jgi:flagella basal body P-ring formation protein FlgA